LNFEHNKIASARISWLPNESEDAKLIGNKLKNFLSKKNNLGVLAADESQSYLNRTFLKKYLWNNKVKLSNAPLFDWLGTVRIIPKEIAEV
jgi:hypothetical protein